MGSTDTGRRSGTAAVLAGLFISTVVALTACDSGGGGTADRPPANASERSDDRPSRQPDATTSMGEPDETSTPSARGTAAGGARATRSPDAEPQEPGSRESGRTTAPARAADRSETPTAAAPAEPTQTTTRATPPAEEPAPAQRTATAETPTRPAASAVAVQPEPTPTTQAVPAPVPAASASAVAAIEPGGVGPFGWLVLGSVAAAMVIGGLLIYRSQRRSAWDAEARGLEAATRAVTATRLPPVLTATTTGRRGLAWPPVRDDLIALITRWDGLTDQSVGEPRRNWSARISGLLRQLVAAVDADDEALATGGDRTPVRARIDEVQRALDAMFTGQPWPEPPAAGQPGSPAYGT